MAVFHQVCPHLHCHLTCLSCRYSFLCFHHSSLAKGVAIYRISFGNKPKRTSTADSLLFGPSFTSSIFFQPLSPLFFLSSTSPPDAPPPLSGPAAIPHCPECRCGYAGGPVSYPHWVSPPPMKLHVSGRGCSPSGHPGGETNSMAIEAGRVGSSYSSPHAGAHEHDDPAKGRRSFIPSRASHVVLPMNLETEPRHIMHPGSREVRRGCRRRPSRGLFIPGRRIQVFMSGQAVTNVSFMPLI